MPHDTIDYFDSFITIRYSLTMLLTALYCLKVRKYSDEGSKVQYDETQGDHRDVFTF